MRILHFADLHLGVENYGRTDTATGLNTRFLDFLAALDKLTSYAIDNHIDLVLFCGDAYKNREPTQTQQREFARRIKLLSEKGIPAFLLVGNHDLPNAAGHATSTEIFDTLEVTNVYVAHKPGIYPIQTAGGILQVAALPWLRRSALLTREETKNLDVKQIKEKMENVLTGIIKKLAADLDRSLPSVLAAHVSILGAQASSESNMSLGVEHNLLVGNIADPAFDYVALGHIHRRQILHASPPVVYAGSLERVDFGEEDDDKGFYEIEILTGQDGAKHTSYNFHKLDGRRFLTIKVDIAADDMSPTDSVIKAITENDITDAIVRLRITLPEQGSTRLNDSEIRTALKSAHFFTITCETIGETRLTRFGKFTAEELTPLNALKAYLEAKKVDPPRAAVLLEYGEKLINNQE